MDRTDGGSALLFRGTLSFAEAAVFWSDVRELTQAPAARVDFDLTDVDTADGGTMALLVQLKFELAAQGVESDLVGASEQVLELYSLYGGEDRECLHEAPETVGVLTQVGDVTLALLGEMQGALAFIGDLLHSVWGAIKKPYTVRWSDVAPIMERAGADGLMIVVLINFLVGFIMAFQGAAVLKLFGANVLVADLVGLSVTRELGPLMTAIIVCGRSGAAFAAEIGTMKVSEEVDALRTLGFDPMRFLVFPRTIALLVALPLLTIIADAVGILGGLLVGIIALDLTVVEYAIQTQARLVPMDIIQGIMKSFAFALAIGFISCQQGLATTGGATGVGRRTTSAVVTILLSLILIDAAFTVTFYALGL